MKTRPVLNISFMSNCLIEALKAKYLNPSVKIHFVTPWQNYKESKVFCPHWYWVSTDGTKFWFFADHQLKWYEFIWHPGKIVMQTKDNV